jgi:tRNA-2-methylthio-N6-dimethylallyladenosine synthase
MGDQVAEPIKEERNRDLLDLVNECARRANEPLIGRTVSVLCEGPSKTNPERLMGRTRTNKIVIFDRGPDLVGQLVNIRIEHATGFSLYGTPQSARKTPLLAA